MKKTIGFVIGVVGLVLDIIWFSNQDNSVLIIVGSLLIAISYHLLGLHKVFGKKKDKTVSQKTKPQNGQIRYSERNLPGFQKQLDESITIVDTTVKPDVFFSRYDFLIKTLTRIIETEKFYKIKNAKSIELYELLDKPETREEQINELIKRSHARLLSEMSNLKTEKGKTNKAEKYFEEMGKYADKMYSSNLVFLNNLKQQALMEKAAP